MESFDQEPPPLPAAGAALFLDFDGTLVELAETPDAVQVSTGLASLLARASERLGGRLAIVSGRSIADLERHLDCSGITVAGSHGLELRFAEGTVVPIVVPEGLGTALERARKLAAEMPGLLLEEKPAGLALHFRRAPHHADRVGRAMAQIAAETGLTVQQGKMLVELRPPGADKGDALRTFMRELPFAGTRPFFVGDDLTDEHAFEAASVLGGGGILVGPPRPTAARWRLEDVDAVAAWIERSVAGDA